MLPCSQKSMKPTGIKVEETEINVYIKNVICREMN